MWAVQLVDTNWPNYLEVKCIKKKSSKSRFSVNFLASLTQKRVLTHGTGFILTTSFVCALGAPVIKMTNLIYLIDRGIIIHNTEGLWFKMNIDDRLCQALHSALFFRDRRGSSILFLHLVEVVWIYPYKLWILIPK